MESIEIFMEYCATLLVYHALIGILMAGIALAVNHYIPYSFVDKPKDVMYRKFVFFGILVLVFVISFLADTLYVMTSIIDDLGYKSTKAKNALEEIYSVRVITALLSALIYAGVYYGIAYYLKTIKLFKCYSVFKFK